MSSMRFMLDTFLLESADVLELLKTNSEYEIKITHEWIPFLYGFDHCCISWYIKTQASNTLYTTRPIPHPDAVALFNPPQCSTSRPWED